MKAVAAFFGNTIHKWAQVLHPGGKHDYVNFEAMMQEVAEHGGLSGTAATFRRDVIYFLHSGFVHSTASSTRSFRHLKAETYFTCGLGPNAFHRVEALGGANICMIEILQLAAAYLGFTDLDAELDTIFEGMKASFEQAPDASDGAAPAS